jgi:hypothetical protein
VLQQVEAAPAEGKEPTIVAEGQREKKHYESNRVKKPKQRDDEDDDDDDNKDKRTKKHDSGEDRKGKKKKEHDDNDDDKHHENGKVKNKNNGKVRNKNNGKDKHKDDDDNDKYEKNWEQKGSSTLRTPVTPAQDLSTAEQGSTVTDSEESTTAGTSVTPAQDLSTQQVQLTTEITTTVTYVPVTTKPPACDTQDIALLYVQYVLKSLGQNADGNILYNGHKVPVQFFVRVLNIQGADVRDVTTDNLRNIALLYIIYDLHELPQETR